MVQNFFERKKSFASAECGAKLVRTSFENILLINKMHQYKMHNASYGKIHMYEYE